MKSIRIFNEVDGSCSYSACRSGPCKQGRRICPSPEACQLPEKKYSATRDFVWIVVGISLLALAAAFAPHY